MNARKPSRGKILLKAMLPRYMAHDTKSISPAGKQRGKLLQLNPKPLNVRKRDLFPCRGLLHDSCLGLHSSHFDFSLSLHQITKLNHDRLLERTTVTHLGKDRGKKTYPHLTLSSLASLCLKTLKYEQVFPQNFNASALTTQRFF